MIIGEIIRCFDEHDLGENYFDDLDISSYRAAKRVFPDIARVQLFQDIKICGQARSYWKMKGVDGVYELINNLHNILGGDPGNTER